MSIDVLQERIRALKNPTMVGLDPTPEVVPGYLLEEARQELGATPAAAAAAYGRFCRELLEGLRDVVPAVKVQSACFDVLGSAGTAAMQEILAYARDLGYYVLLDSMRGDVTDIAQRCAQAVFGTVEEAGPGYQPYPCDAITVNGYLGGDSIKPFLPYCRDGGKSLFILVKTSNRSSVEVQDLLSGGRLVHTAMADLVNRWGGPIRRFSEACGPNTTGCSSWFPAMALREAQQKVSSTPLTASAMAPWSALPGAFWVRGRKTGERAGTMWKGPCRRRKK